jgi:hypothetical protein
MAPLNLVERIALPGLADQCRPVCNHWPNPGRLISFPVTVLVQLAQIFHALILSICKKSLVPGKM